MVMMVERKRSASEAEPTDFGWLLTILMRKKRLKSVSALIRALKADDYPISQQMVSRYINGQSKVPLGFVSQTIKTLDLDEDDQSALSNKWAETLPGEERDIIMRVWESRRPARENIEAARQVEDEETEAGKDGARGSKGQEA